VYPESNVVRWAGAVDSSQYQDQCAQTVTEQDFCLTVLHPTSELLRETFNVAMRHLLIRSADIELVLESLDVVNIPCILEFCTTRRKGSDDLLLEPQKLTSTFQK
jgi:hypothetical protein